jgi:hypothetical protein
MDKLLGLINELLNDSNRDVEDMAEKVSAILYEASSLLANNEIVASGRAPMSMEYLQLGDVVVILSNVGATLTKLAVDVKGGKYV